MQLAGGWSLLTAELCCRIDIVITPELPDP